MEWKREREIKEIAKWYHSSSSSPFFLVVVSKNLVHPKCNAYKISNWRFGDKAERGKHVNLEKWRTRASRGQRDVTTCDRDKRATSRNFSVRLGNSLCSFFRGKKRPACVIDEIDVTVSGIERWRTAFAVSRHSFCASSRPVHVSSSKQSPNSRLSMRRRCIAATKTYRLRIAWRTATISDWKPWIIRRSFSY